MSECVVRMEMPHDGLCDLEQTLIYGLGTYCAVNGERCNYSDTGIRPDYCPILCQLPEGHGRLVDADALKEKAVHYSETEYHFDHDAVEMDDIDDAPTIVPAEAPKEE